MAGPWLPWQPADAGTSPASSTAPPGATGCGVSNSVRSPLGLLAQWWSLLARLLGWGAGVSAGVVDNSHCHPGLLCGWQWAEKGCCNNVPQTKALTRQLRIVLSSGGGTRGPGAGRRAPPKAPLLGEPAAVFSPCPHVAFMPAHPWCRPSSHKDTDSVA